MKIGIDASRAFLGERTGIEEYSFRIISHLREKLGSAQVFLYLRQGQEAEIEKIGWALPSNWEMRIIPFPILWTQLGLSLEMLFRPVDVLFVPGHVAPLIHPERTIVTVHGLEYEVCPETYSFWERFYMRWSIRFSCRAAERIVAVSENTRRDLIERYRVPGKKITVSYEGAGPVDRRSEAAGRPPVQRPELPYLLFIGRLEERKNISGIIRAFEILKERYRIPHQLVLVGKGGYGSNKISDGIDRSAFRREIILTGFVGTQEKQELLEGASVFLFPTFYEGFGLPVVEAQDAGIPVIASRVGSLPEVAGEGAILVDPKDPSDIARAAFRIIAEPELRDDIIRKGKVNARRFSWEKASREVAELMLG